MKCILRVIRKYQEDASVLFFCLSVLVWQTSSSFIPAINFCFSNQNDITTGYKHLLSYFLITRQYVDQKRPRYFKFGSVVARIMDLDHFPFNAIIPTFVSLYVLYGVLYLHQNYSFKIRQLLFQENFSKLYAKFKNIECSIVVHLFT